MFCPCLSSPCPVVSPSPTYLTTNLTLNSDELFSATVRVKRCGRRERARMQSVAHAGWEAAHYQPKGNQVDFDQHCRSPSALSLSKAHTQGQVSQASAHSHLRPLCVSVEQTSITAIKPSSQCDSIETQCVPESRSCQWLECSHPKQGVASALLCAFHLSFWTLPPDFLVHQFSRSLIASPVSLLVSSTHSTIMHFKGTLAHCHIYVQWYICAQPHCTEYIFIYILIEMDNPRKLRESRLEVFTTYLLFPAALNSQRNKINCLGVDRKEERADTDVHVQLVSLLTHLPGPREHNRK